MAETYPPRRKEPTGQFPPSYPLRCTWMIEDDSELGMHECGRKVVAIFHAPDFDPMPRCRMHFTEDAKNTCASMPGCSYEEIA